MAGTPIDTKMGAILLYNNNFNEIIEIPISETPSEQTVFQVSDMEYKENIINSYIDRIKKQNCNVLFVYCNSLSGSVNFEKITEKNNIRIITPMDVYREIAFQYKNIAVISANAQGLAGIERVIFQKNREIKITGVTLLEMVKEIEKGSSPFKILEKFDFLTLVKYFETMNIETIILGCTHFPYIKEELEKITDLEIIDPGIKMVQKI